MSTVTCQNVTNGIQNISPSRSWPAGSSSQSGRFSNSDGLHQATGSEPCRYSTRVPSHGASAGPAGWVGSGGEPDDPPVPENRFGGRAVRVPTRLELLAQRVEIRWAG